MKWLARRKFKARWAELKGDRDISISDSPELDVIRGTEIYDGYRLMVESEDLEGIILKLDKAKMEIDLKKEMEETRENIIFMFEMFADDIGDAFTDGSDIVLLTSSEEANYIIKHDDSWYRVIFDLDDFCNKNYNNVDITPIDKDFPEEYLEKVYFKHGFDWNEHGEMIELNR